MRYTITVMYACLLPVVPTLEYRVILVVAMIKARGGYLAAHACVEIVATCCCVTYLSLWCILSALAVLALDVLKAEQIHTTALELARLQGPREQPQVGLVVHDDFHAMSVNSDRQTL